MEDNNRNAIIDDGGLSKSTSLKPLFYQYTLYGTSFS